MLDAPISLGDLRSNPSFYLVKLTGIILHLCGRGTEMLGRREPWIFFPPVQYHTPSQSKLFSSDLKNDSFRVCVTTFEKFEKFVVSKIYNISRKLKRVN